MKKKFKDWVLDLSVHYWIHLVSVGCVVALLCVNKHQHYFIEHQEKVMRDLYDIADGYYYLEVDAVLADVLRRDTPTFSLKHIRYSSRKSGYTIAYSYGLTDEEGRDFLSLEPTLREKLGSKLGGKPRLYAPKWVLRMSEGDDLDKPLPPGYKWYTAEVTYTLPPLAGAR